MTAVHWTTDYTGIGNSFGYAVHNERARQAVAATGIELDSSAPVAMHVTPPHRFEPIAGKRNIAYVAWEANELPELFKKTLWNADAVCVTASFLKAPFEAILPHVPIHVVPLGVDFDQYPFVDRRRYNRPNFRPANRNGGRPFRFLWVGAPNVRKGPKHVFEAWKAFEPGNEYFPEFADKYELYFKTTTDDKAYVGVKRVGNIIYDTRKLSVADLSRVYANAHCFLFPSVGEGFGLTFAEAQATGLPSIYTAATAMLDLCPPELELGYTLEFDWTPDHWSWKDADASGNPMEVDVKIANANPTALVGQMIHVANNYEAALDRGRRGSEFIRQFTWEACGRRLRDVVESVSQHVEGVAAHE